MRYLSPRKTPDMSLHRGSGQAVVRFVEHREGDDRGTVNDDYLGVFGSAGVKGQYDEARRAWIERSLAVGWAPAEWKPAETGHEGVLTVGGLVEGYRRHLDGVWGEGWRRVDVTPDLVGEIREYGAALERARELMRTGRYEGEPRTTTGGKRLVLDARSRHGHLDDALEKLWTARVLDDLVSDFGALAAAVFGDRELRRLRARWAAEGRPVSDRKAGMGVVRDAYLYVVGREPRAPWNLDRAFLEQNAGTFGLDLGIVGPDGRWVRTV